MSQELVVQKAIAGKELSTKDIKDLVTFIDESTREVNGLSVKIAKTKEEAKAANKKAMEAKAKAEQTREGLQDRKSVV